MFNFVAAAVVVVTVVSWTIWGAGPTVTLVGGIQHHESCWKLIESWNKWPCQLPMMHFPCYRGTVLEFPRYVHTVRTASCKISTYLVCTRKKFLLYIFRPCLLNAFDNFRPHAVENCQIRTVQGDESISKFPPTKSPILIISYLHWNLAVTTALN